MKTSLSFWITAGLILAALGLSGIILTSGNPAALFWVTVGYFTYDSIVSYVFLVATGQGLRHPPAQVPNGPVPELSLLIAAHNEKDCILETLASVFSQRRVTNEILLASDGSTDGMNELLIREFSLVPHASTPHLWCSEEGWALQLLTLPKIGKASALNAALSLARHPVVVTLDADTKLAPSALAELAGAFRDPQTAAAGGFIYVRNGPSRHWLPRYQFVEYLKNYMWRIGLAHAGVCLQVSGAFGAIRTPLLRQVGAFQPGSLTEDYEIIYRLHRWLHDHHQPYRIAMVPRAVAWTDGPETIPSLLRQRTRWFTGFLQTLWDYRKMIGHSAYGRLGLFMLPLKCIDSVVPLWGLSSFIILVGALASGRQQWHWTAGLVFGGKWLIDMVIILTLFRWHRRHFSGQQPPVPRGITVFCAMTEGLTFHWLRHLAVIQAYGWLMARVKKWDQPRWKTAPSSLSTEA